MQDNGLLCWKCGASIGDEPLPLSRMAECRTCHAQLHVCRLCKFYDIRVAKACRETVADEVRDKERANFCGYFQPRPNAFTGTTTSAANTRDALDALFGGQPDGAEKPSNPLDDLFRKN